MSRVDAAWKELVLDALASDGPIRDSDVKEAVARNRPLIEAALLADTPSVEPVDVERLARAFGAAWDNNSWHMTSGAPGLIVRSGQTLEGVVAEQVAAEYAALPTQASDSPEKP